MITGMHNVRVWQWECTVSDTVLLLGNTNSEIYATKFDLQGKFSMFTLLSYTFILSTAC